ncbi:hypothetical protein [Streptomyces sp. NPDC002044]|uniref:hypothetical protein n=1 Tax=Streptomyces sp. NPDC002044 TaxID=3154662 RepID=UPI00331F33CF
MTHDTARPGAPDPEQVRETRELLTLVRRRWLLADWSPVAAVVDDLAQAVLRGDRDQIEVLLDVLRTKSPPMANQSVGGTGPAPAEVTESIDRILVNTADTTAPQGPGAAQDPPAEGSA